MVRNNCLRATQILVFYFYLSTFSIVRPAVVLTPAKLFNRFIRLVIEVMYCFTFSQTFSNEVAHTTLGQFLS